MAREALIAGLLAQPQALQRTRSPPISHKRSVVDPLAQPFSQTLPCGMRAWGPTGFGFQIGRNPPGSGFKAMKPRCNRFNYSSAVVALASRNRLFVLCLPCALAMRWWTVRLICSLAHEFARLHSRPKSTIERDSGVEFCELSGTGLAQRIGACCTARRACCTAQRAHNTCPYTHLFISTCRIDTQTLVSYFCSYVVRCYPSWSY